MWWRRRSAPQLQNPTTRAKCTLADEAMVNLHTLRSHIMQQQQQIEQGLAPTGSNQFAPDYRVDLDILKVDLRANYRVDRHRTPSRQKAHVDSPHGSQDTNKLTCDR